VEGREGLVPTGATALEPAPSAPHGAAPDGRASGATPAGPGIRSSPRFEFDSGRGSHGSPSLHPVRAPRDLRMNRATASTAAAVLVATASLLGPWRSTPATDVEVARRVSRGVAELCAVAEPAVVQVLAYGANGRRYGGATEGSGVIVRPDGTLLTNNHVVKDGGRFQVVLSEGRRVAAEVLALDPATDLAVLRIRGDRPGTTYPTLPIAPRPAQVGESVLVLGNPFGIGSSVSQGIVSGLGRSDLNLATYEDFIQTDAVINPGNSGGPMINLEGEVVGIATAQGLEKEGDLGIGFAIPASLARHVLEEVLENGEVIRGWLGVSVDRWFSPSRVEGYDGVSRVRVRSFETVSPARDAGIQPGDILLAVGGRRLVTRKDLMTSVAVLDPGDTVEVRLWRSGRELTVPVSIARRPDGEE
jgi:serine protease DegS